MSHFCFRVKAEVAVGCGSSDLIDLTPCFGFSGWESGPTVVGPLLDFIRPSKQVNSVLKWEGTAHSGSRGWQ